MIDGFFAGGRLRPTKQKRYAEGEEEENGMREADEENEPS